MTAFGREKESGAHETGKNQLSVPQNRFLSPYDGAMAGVLTGCAQGLQWRRKDGADGGVERGADQQCLGAGFRQKIMIMSMVETR